LIYLDKAIMRREKALKEKLPTALEFCGRAVAENPWRASHRAAYAQTLRQLKRWTEACEQAEAWVRAREEFSRIERLKPSNLPVMKAHFAAEMGEK
jgi:hypothetical protein